MKDGANRVIGFELLHYKPPNVKRELKVETFVLSSS
jgi:hypothetical protein